MCGISGFVDPQRCGLPEELTAIARSMAAAIRHRGPDDEGVWVEPKVGLGLGHRRLSIVDLSHEGHQPMLSAKGRYVLAFNGEIYNFQGLRRELEALGARFRGHSDTEVMLAAICEWGLEAALKRFVGMFALALWDLEERTLHLARDRMGEKPLYYGWNNGVFLFGSELRALRAHPSWQSAIDRDALASFLRYRCVPAPDCIYESISKLIPGCYLSLTEAQMAKRHIPEPIAYWSVRSTAENGIAHPFEGTAHEATEQLAHLLLDSVGQQLIADVPLGAFLSGGIDSSLVVALMQTQSSRPIKTFCIGFKEEKYNEARHAKEVARHLGTQHTEFYVESKELQEIIYALPAVYDEPFADSSQIPTVLLCRLARQQVTVSLSGDAGDELFGGYAHYFKTERLWKALKLLPASARAGLASTLARIGRTGASFKAGRVTDILNRITNLSELMPSPDDYSLYRLLMSCARDPQDWLKKGMETPSHSNKTSSWQSLPGLLQRMMYLDSVSYLPDDILVKVDRAAMSVGLETRVPLLDHRVIEFAWKLPRSLLFREGQGKWLPRQVLYRYVPRELVERPKQGFGVPLAAWLRGPLRDWVEDLIGENRLRQEGYFCTETVRRRWQEHLLNKRDWSASLWSILMFQAWLGDQTSFPADPDPHAGVLSQIGAGAKT